MPDFLDRLAEELVRAARAPATETIAPSLARPRVRRLRGPGHVRRRWLLAALALLIAGATAAAIATRGRPTPGPVPPRPGAALTLVPDGADRATFAILRRPTSSADEIPLRLPLALSGSSGANLQAARRAAAPGPGEAWVVPGRGSVCLIAAWPAQHAGGSSCVPDAAAARGALYVSSGSARTPGVDYLAGLVPDGVRAVTVLLPGGLGTRVGVHENVYVVAVPGNPLAVIFAGPHGPVTVQRVGLPDAGNGR